MRRATLIFCLALAGCTQFPDLDGTVAPDLEQADFPDFLPTDQLRAGAATSATDPGETTAAPDARIRAGARSRAAALQRRRIVDEADQTRLEGARN